MPIQLIVPTLGESITEATVSKWLKKIGESFEIDEPDDWSFVSTIFKSKKLNKR